MKVKARVNKRIFHRDDFYIFGMSPCGRYDDLILHPQYHNFTIKGNSIGYLCEGEEYELNLEQKADKNGVYYEIKSCPTLEKQDLSNLNKDDAYKIMCNVTTPTQSNYVLEAYPNFVQLVMEDRMSEICVDKIYNVGEFRLSAYARDIKAIYKYYHIIQDNSIFDLSNADCEKLETYFTSAEKIKEHLISEPYKCLIDICGRGFEKVDMLCMEHFPELRESEERKVYAVQWILKDNEDDYNSKILANDMVYYLKDFDKCLCNNIVEIVKSNEKFHYDEETKYLSLSSTWLAECNIAQFIKDHLNNANPLDIDYTQYKDIKEGVLTDEQSNVLKSVCENGVTILNAKGGTGKTSTLKAVVQMLEDNCLSYRLLAPTGRVAQRITELTNRKASTIHRAVFSGSLCEDIICVEEFGMIGIELMSMLVTAIENPKSRLLLIGDLGQIPPLNVGCVMKDMINSKKVPNCSLSTVFRFKEGGLSKISTLAYDGINYLKDTSRSNYSTTFGEKKDYTFVNSDGSTEQIITEYKKLLQRGISPIDISVITPWNVTEKGTVNLNNLIQETVNPITEKDNVLKYTYTSNRFKKEIKFKQGDLVLNTKNDYNMLTLAGYNLLQKDEILSEDTVATTAIFNGEIGEIIKVEDNCLFVQIGERTVVFQQYKIRNLLLGYTITSFKIQGSENKYIMVITDPIFEESLNMNVMYTNLTRATHELVEIGDLDLITRRIGISGVEDRLTWLKELLICEKIVE